MFPLLSLSLILGSIVWQPKEAFTQYQNSPQQRIEQTFEDCERGCWSFVQTSTGIQQLVGQDVIEMLFGCTTNSCIIRQNRGGQGLLYGLAAKVALSRPGASFVIEKECNSACITFIDIARERVCLQPKSRLGFHKWYSKINGVITRRYDPTYSADIDLLVRENIGGYPVNMYFVPAEKAKGIWPVCGLNPPLPRPRPQEVAFQPAFFLKKWPGE
jgi:hypothetical protein